MKKQGSRVFHLMMILPAGILLLVLSLVSLSTLAVTNNQFTHEYESRTQRSDANCILYAESRGSRDIKFADGDTCMFSIAGSGVLGVLALLFTVVLVMKAIIGVDVFSMSALIEFVISVLGSIWAFIVSVVLTAGLEATCNAYAESYKEDNLDKFPCCSYYYGESIDDSSNVYFYEGLNASRITAWFAMVLLMFLSAVYVSIIIRSCCEGRTKSTTKEEKTEEVVELSMQTQ